MKESGSRFSLFLMELVIDLFLCVLCAAVCVGLLVHARRMSAQSTRLTQAVYLAQSAAETWKATGTQPAEPAAQSGGLELRYTAEGNRLDIAVYQGEELLYELEGVTYLG